jgi:hypothetical protein
LLVLKWQFPNIISATVDQKSEYKIKNFSGVLENLPCVVFSVAQQFILAASNQQLGSKQSFLARAMMTFDVQVVRKEEKIIKTVEEEAYLKCHSSLSMGYFPY